MKSLFIFALVLLVACSSVNEKIFVANEASGSISVIDASSLKEIKRVSLTLEHDGVRLEYAPHNVQVAGDKVLITANTAHKEEEHEEMNHDMDGEHEMSASDMKIPTGIIAVSAHGDEEEPEKGNHPDQLVIMDAKSNKILDRIDLDMGAHLAHVVSDGKYAYITSTDKGVLYKVDLDKKTSSFIALPEGSMPHGLRLAEDKKTAIIADMMGGLLLVNLDTKNITTIKLPGKGVQAGIVNNIAMASVFDTKQLALYDLASKELSFVDLPNAKGPIQMYQTTDNNFAYIADQGVYFDQPPGRNVYKIDLAQKKVVATIESGDAPHGVVVSPDNRVWVTNLNGNSVTVIQNDRKIAEIPVAAAPNGISYWHMS